MDRKNNTIRFAVPGFLAGGIPSGIKKNRGKDLALIYSETPAVTAAVFTQNRVKAAPVLVSMERVERQHLSQAVVVNSGSANACTGSVGLDDARFVARLVALELNIDENLVLVASTGVIGKRLPVDTISSNIPQLVRNSRQDGILSAAEAIMTTDTCPKVVLKKEIIGDKEITICGLAKGAGMIMPKMATMLSFVLTDTAIEAETLKKVFCESIDYSFNSITIDGETSTNDMALVLANGRAGNQIISGPSRDLEQFGRLLGEVLVNLARMIVKDGEGATKFVEISVMNARDDLDAREAAFSVANSSLVKTAFFGEDCNWGRIVSAIGSSGANIDPEKINVSFDDVILVRNGVGLGDEAERRANKVLGREEFKVLIDLNCGSGKAKVFTTDLSSEYIEINANYRT